MLTDFQISFTDNLALNVQQRHNKMFYHT